jgi:hypothetical protein
MRRQSQEVGWLIRDRDEAHAIHLRMAIRESSYLLDATNPNQ